MILIILVVTLLFLCNTFFPNITPIVQHNLLAYFFYQTTVLLKNYTIVLLVFVILTALFIRFNFDRKYSLSRIFFFSAMQTVFVTVLAFFISYIFLFVIAFTQLTFFSVLYHINPKIVGVELDKKAIVQNLQQKVFHPDIVVTRDDQSDILSAITSVPTGSNNYYGRSILPSIPHFLIVPIKKPNESFLLIDNSLIVIQAKENDLQAIAPYLGYHLIKNYFPTKKIKSESKIIVLGQERYAEYRQEDAQKKLEKIDSELEKIAGKVSSLSATIELNNDNIAGSTELISQDKKQSVADYQKCFRDRNPSALCKDLQARWNTKIKAENEKIDKWKQENKANAELIDAYGYYDNFFKVQKQNLSLLTERVPNEDGVFLPKDSIRIVVTGSDSQAIIAFLETLTHEYLHYTSYESDTKKFDSTFFEEGLTEFFARKIVKNSVHLDTNFGYPVQVKIITAMTNMITETEFADLYFAKDEEGLEKALDRVYGDGFYKNNYISFETLQYVSDPKQIVKIANGIMKKIGGEAVTEKDLYSSESIPE